MKNSYRTMQGKAVNMEAMRVQHENTIAVGNMKTNARGDELGPGGVVVRTRDQVMKEYYDSNAVYTKERVDASSHNERMIRSGQEPAPIVEDMPDDILAQDAMMDEIASGPALRGPLADAVAKSAKVEQKLLTPKKSGNGPSRI
jgi:hypothetical protein